MLAIPPQGCKFTFEVVGSARKLKHKSCFCHKQIFPIYETNISPFNNLNVQALRIFTPQFLHTMG